VTYEPAEKIDSTMAQVAQTASPTAAPTGASTAAPTDSAAASSQGSTKTRLLCPSKEIFELLQKVENEVTTPILTKPRFFCVLKGDIIGYVRNMIHSHASYAAVEDLFCTILRGAQCSEKFVRLWAPRMSAKMFDFYQRSAANDFVLRFSDQMTSLQNCTERLEFRNQVLTGTVNQIKS
jgi:hypothetical protein